MRPGADRRLVAVSRRALAILVLLTVAGTDRATARQAPADVADLAEYRLTVPVFRRFQLASERVAAATRDEPRFARDPLFTREVALSGDATAAAAALEMRLLDDPALAGALATAALTAGEFTRFALTLIAARLAHGFVAAGVIQAVPAGAAADNVAFVEAHQRDVAAVLDLLDVDDGAR